MNPQDMIGRVFGKLLVEEYVGMVSEYGRNRTAYRCKCTCGKEVIVCRHSLQSGKRRSCGECFRIEEDNGFCRYFDCNNESFIFDMADLDLVKKYRWLINAYGYPVTRIDCRNHGLTRMLLNPPEGVYVDHINGDTRDNRRENLRLAQKAENQRNMRIAHHNTSGFKGVGYSREKCRYRAYISLNNKSKHLGYFNTAEEAARAYDEAARFYFGQFACVNFPKEGEQCCRRAIS